jgi:Fic family protein
LNPKHFKSKNAGQCVRTIGRYWAFLPALLPPTLEFDNSLVLTLSKADAALGEVAGLALGGAMPRMQMLIHTFARREAVLSSRIEGTQTQLDDLFLAEMDRATTPRSADLREVQNYVQAIEQGIQLLEQWPIASRLVLRLHEILMDGVRGGDRTPGEFRKIQNFIGSTGDTVETAKYVPPPVEHLPELLANWEQFVNQRDQFPDLIQCAIMHEQFEAIHPFQDGNGRIGRLLITLFLIQRKRLPQPLLYLSVFIEANRREYYDLLQGVRTHGDWVAWIKFFLTGVTQTSRQAVRQARHLDQMRREYRDRLKGKHRARDLLEDLFANPYITAARAAERLKVTKPTAQKSIDLLCDLGLLEEITGQAWGRIYVAKSILKAMEAPPPDEAHP